ncbi:MAG: DUF881 domain-containing protein [Micropruina sp.]|uniref:DUF881 domain-containing protein n=1 Tax=Micropruina sp. TaxID=2737536 RepID=UPI0039E68EA1
MPESRDPDAVEPRRLDEAADGDPAGTDAAPRRAAGPDAETSADRTLEESTAPTPASDEPASDGPASDEPEPDRPMPDEPASPAPIGWRELVRDFVKPGRAQVVFAAILLVCGLAVVMQVRSQSSETDYSTLRRADLVQLLDDLTGQSRQLESEIAQLEETQRRLQSGVDSERVAREEAQRRLDILAILGGTAPAQGPGVRITINDPQRKVTAELLLNTIEEMRDAGAEVIAINGTVRVVASTWFGTGSNGRLLVDNHPISTPITIDVIGDPHALTEAAGFSGGLISEVQGSRIGGSVDIVRDEKLTITAVVAPPANRFAKPA